MLVASLSNVSTATIGRNNPQKLQPVATSVVYVIADLHFGDETTCARGRRPFANATEMDAEIVRRWNETVRAEDTVYVLGDIGKRYHIQTVRSLRGRKHLVLGNCDDVVRIAASNLFATISVAKRLSGVLFTHIPVHPSQLRGCTLNVHGHLHAATVSDPRYQCVSVEHTGFAPVRLNNLLD